MLYPPRGRRPPILRPTCQGNLRKPTSSGTGFALEYPVLAAMNARRFPPRIGTASRMLPWDHFIWFASYILLFTALSGFGAHRIKVMYHFWKHRADVPQPKREFDELPVVTVQLPIFNEFDVVENLLRCVAALDYPKEKLQIQVLDDSTDETAAFAEKLSAEYAAKGLGIEYRHRTNRHGFKAGALHEAMPFAKGEFICIFDADFQPAPDYLNKLIHHFTDETVGMVQARWGHANRHFSLLTRLQALFLDGHLVLEQTARSRHGEFLNFNGTAGIWRRTAITESGGWQHDTLTEDLDLRLIYVFFF